MTAAAPPRGLDAKGPPTLLPHPDQAPSPSAQAPAWGPLALAVGAWLWASWALLAWHQSPMDEANHLAQAWRMAQGERLYQELWEFVSPLPFVWMAAVYRVCGPGLESARWSAALLLGLSMAALWGLARRGGASHWGAAWAATVLALGLLPYLRAYYHHWVAWAFALGAWWVVAQGLLQGLRASAPWALAGALTGGAAWCNLPVGAVAGLALAWAAWSSEGGGRWWRSWAALAGAFALMMGLGSLAFAWEGGAAALWQQTLLWPATHYKQPGGMNDVAPFSDWGAFLRRGGQSLWLWPWDVAAKLAVQGLHLLGGAVGLGALGAAWRAGKEASGAEAAPQGLGVEALRGLLGAGALLAWAAAWHGRADHTHLAIAALPSLALLASWRPTHLARGLGVAGAISLALVAGQELRTLRAFAQEGRVAWGLDASIAQSEGVRWVKAHLPAGARVQSFPCQGLLLLFAPVKLATPYALVHPPNFKLWGEAEHTHFRALLQAHPPDALVLAGPWLSREEIEATVGAELWGRYRQAGQSRGWVAASFWLPHAPPSSDANRAIMAPAAAPEARPAATRPGR